MNRVKWLVLVPTQSPSGYSSLVQTSYPVRSLVVIKVLRVLEFSAYVILLERVSKMCNVEMNVYLFSPVASSEKKQNAYNHVNAEQKQMRNEKRRETK